MRPAFSHCFLKRFRALSKDSFSFSFTPGKRSPSFLLGPRACGLACGFGCGPREQVPCDRGGIELAASVYALPPNHHPASPTRLARCSIGFSLRAKILSNPGTYASTERTHNLAHDFRDAQQRAP